jgi:hypothetical protein
VLNPLVKHREDASPAFCFALGSTPGLKARHMTAQGNALGLGSPPCIKPCKGGTINAPCSIGHRISVRLNLSRPFRAGISLGDGYPWALPRAVMLWRF